MILDTNALSAYADGDPAMMALFATAEELVLPVIVLGEYRFGISRSRHRLVYAEWLEEFQSYTRIAGVDLETTYTYALVRDQLERIGKPIPANDIWIASIALQQALPLVSRDRHFDLIPGLQRISW